MPRQFGRTRNVYVATRFILLSSTVESSATSGYVAVPEQFFQNEEPSINNEERTRKKVYFRSESGLNRCNSIIKHVIMIFFDYFSVFYLILVHFSILPSYGKSFWSLVYVIIYWVGVGISTLISISDWSDPYFFHRKMEKTRFVKEEMEGKLFNKVLFPTLYLYLACKHFYFPPRKRYNWRNESTKAEIHNITLIISWLYWLRLVVYSKE